MGISDGRRDLSSSVFRSGEFKWYENIWITLFLCCFSSLRIAGCVVVVDVVNIFVVIVVVAVIVVVNIFVVIVGVIVVVVENIFVGIVVAVFFIEAILIGLETHWLKMPL